MAALAAFRAGLIAALTVLVVLTALPETADAQNLPGGSWRQTCRNAVMAQGNLLQADCQRRDGNWNRTAIDMDSCGRGGTAANINGQLTCESQGGGVTHGGNLPGGSWRQTCRNAMMGQGNTLQADCQRRDGGWNRTSIDMDRCGRGGTAANINGQLTCEGQGNQGGNQGGGHAGPGGQGGGKWWGQGLPAGSYQRSCRNARVEGRDLLIAQCQRQNGSFRQTRLDIDDCRGRDIANDNGHLECGGKTYGGSYGQYQLPPGSWTQTCRNARIIRDDLHAECRQRDNDWVRASIDLDDCRGQQVHNDNGRLVCGGMRGQGGQGGFGGQQHGGGFGGNNLPHGSWQQSCRNARYEGNGVMTADCRQRDGDWKTDSINVPNCNGRPIHNENGLLRC